MTKANFLGGVGVLKFTKMHGLGNDYVYVNCLKEQIENIPNTAIKVSDRHTGIGSDGLVLILPSETADFRMRMFNSDGSEAEMCGNAIRCVGKYVFDNNLTQKSKISIETLAGTKNLDMTIENSQVSLVRVDMGEPVLIPERIPVNSSKESFVAQPIECCGTTYCVTCVSMGNPHAVIYLDDIDSLKLDVIGPCIENHSLFPNRINTEFVKIHSRSVLQMRVWERGAGETLACGTGACAVLVSSVLNNLSDRKAVVKLLGGDLLIEWNELDNKVYMTGPAVKVFDGVFYE